MYSRSPSHAKQSQYLKEGKWIVAIKPYKKKLKTTTTPTTKIRAIFVPFVRNIWGPLSIKCTWFGRVSVRWQNVKTDKRNQRCMWRARESIFDRNVYAQRSYIKRRLPHHVVTIVEYRIFYLVHSIRCGPYSPMKYKYIIQP